MQENREHRRMVLVVVVIYLIMLAGTAKAFVPSAFPKPTVKTVFNGVWALQLESYLQEHLGFHDVLFQLKSRTDLLVGEKMIHGVYVTDERLLEKLLAEDVPSAAEAAAPVNTFYTETGLPTCFVLVPSASEIYETTLPANAVNAEQSTRIQQIYSEMQSGIRCVDAYNVLSSMKEDYIYYRTDTHWTNYGAYYVYQSAIQKMGFTPVPYQRYVISHLSTEFRGDLYARTLYDGVKADVLDLYSMEDGAEITEVLAYNGDSVPQDRSTMLYNESALESKDMYRFYLGNPAERLIIRTNLDNGKKLLLFKDGFADCMVPFLLQHYSEICVVDLELVGEDYLTMADPSEYTQALFLCSMSSWDDLWK